MNNLIHKPTSLVLLGMVAQLFDENKPQAGKLRQNDTIRWACDIALRVRNEHTWRTVPNHIALRAFELLAPHIDSVKLANLNKFGEMREYVAEGIRLLYTIAGDHYELGDEYNGLVQKAETYMGISVYIDHRVDSVFAHISDYLTSLEAFKKFYSKPRRRLNTSLTHYLDGNETLRGLHGTLQDMINMVRMDMIANYGDVKPQKLQINIVAGLEIPKVSQ